MKSKFFVETILYAFDTGHTKGHTKGYDTGYDKGYDTGLFATVDDDGDDDDGDDGDGVFIIDDPEDEKFD